MSGNKMELKVKDLNQRANVGFSDDRTTDDVNPGQQKCKPIVVVILAFTLHIAANILSAYTMNQYAYKAFFAEQYPNSTYSSTGRHAGCTINRSAEAYEEQVVVQKLTSKWNIYCALGSQIFGIISTINLATYSDVYGRKRLFIPPVFGNFLKVFLCAIGIRCRIDMNWFIIFYAIEGCTGSWYALISLVFCVIADVTKEGKPRSLVIGFLELGVGVGSVLSTTLSGYLIQWTDGFFYPAVIAAIIMFVTLLLVIFFLPETVQKSNKRKKVSLCANMLRVTECFRPNFSTFGKRWMFCILLVIFIMSALSHLGRMGVETLYQLNSPFCWGSVQIGVYGALRMLSMSVGGLVLIKVFHFFTTDEYIALAGCVTTLVSLILIGLASTDAVLYLALVAGIGSTVTMPLVRSIMSRMSPINKQGSVFAGIAVTEIVFSTISSVICNAIYNQTVSVYRGIVFFVMAGFAVVGIILCLILITGQRHNAIANLNDVMELPVEEKGMRDTINTVDSKKF